MYVVETNFRASKNYSEFVEISWCQKRACFFQIVNSNGILTSREYGWPLVRRLNNVTLTGSEYDQVISSFLLFT